MATESDGSLDKQTAVAVKDEVPSGAFYISCSCSDKFLDFETYDSHRFKGRSDCRASPVLKQRPYSSNNPFSKANISSEKQLGAFFGDLDHKREVVNRYQKLGNETQSFFDNRHQAWYVKKYFPDYISRPPNSQPPSVKTVGTIFEYHFHTSIAFRFAYLRWLPSKLAFAPFEENEVCADLQVMDLRNPTEVNVDPLIQGVMRGTVKAEQFMLPIGQRDPHGSIPPGDPSVVFNWVNSERYWRNYPELMGYNRQEAFVTSGDIYPWMVSSICNYEGYGCIAVSFPSPRSPFDGEENNPSLGQLDGLSHWQWAGKIAGFDVTLHALSEMTHFLDRKYSGTRLDVQEPFDSLGNKIYLLFKGVPNRRSYFTLQRFVVWNDRVPHMPRPDSPGPGEHPEI